MRVSLWDIPEIVMTNNVGGGFIGSECMCAYLVYVVWDVMMYKHRLTKFKMLGKS